MKSEEIEDLKDALSSKESIIEGLEQQVKELTSNKHYGFYQLCPKCNGEKILLVLGMSVDSVRACPICKGEGVIPRPEIKNMQP